MKEILHDLRSELMRKRILDDGTRIDGRRSLAAIHADLAAGESARLEWPAFKEEFDRLFEVFNAVNKMFLSRDNNR